MKKVLIRPIITEKTLRLSETENQYTFLVSRDTNKIEVAKEIAEKFNVEVLQVRIVNMLGKNVVFGTKRIEGRKSNFKKAIVTLKVGDSISLFKVK